MNFKRSLFSCKDSIDRSKSPVTDNAKRPRIETKYKTRFLKSGPHKDRRTNEEIHSSVFFCPVISAVIDTPAFQRLRHLKQLGTSDYVYINANHSRFEHSVGVCHLAEKLIESIRKKVPAIRKCTNEKDVLCIKLAGLFHDLGHGPYSHVYEDFVKKHFPQYLAEQPQNVQDHYKNELPPVPDKWQHEHCTLSMIDQCLEYLGLEIDVKNLDAPLKQVGNGIDAKSIRVFKNEITSNEMDGGTEENHHADRMILTSRDWIFIKECIMGGPVSPFTTLQGRVEHECEWMYDIVCNKHSGLDVDKIDYFARDGRRCLRESGEIEKLFIEEAVVAWGKCTKSDASDCQCYTREKRRGQHLMICYPEKMVSQAITFFRKRFDLHKRIYQHKTAVAASLMICDIFCKADCHYLISPVKDQLGRDQKTLATVGEPRSIDQPLPLSRAMANPRVYIKLKDSLIHAIAMTNKPELQEARDLIARFESHDVYKPVGYMPLNGQNRIHRIIMEKTEADIMHEMLAFRGTHSGDNRIGSYTERGSEINLTKDDFIVSLGEIHYGLKQMNPLLNLRFVQKEKLSCLTRNIDDLPDAIEGTHPDLLSDADVPCSFIEHSIRVFSRDSAKMDLVKHLFALWWQEINAEIEQTLDNSCPGGPPPVRLSQDDDDESDSRDDDDEISPSTPKKTIKVLGHNTVTPNQKRC